MWHDLRPAANRKLLASNCNCWSVPWSPPSRPETSFEQSHCSLGRATHLLAVLVKSACKSRPSTLTTYLLQVEDRLGLYGRRASPRVLGWGICLCNATRTDVLVQHGLHLETSSQWSSFTSALNTPTLKPSRLASGICGSLSALALPNMFAALTLCKLADLLSRIKPLSSCFLLRLLCGRFISSRFVTGTL